MKVPMLALAIGVWAAALALPVGCQRYSYRIVGMRHYEEKHDPGQDGSMIAFTILNGGITIKADCEAWDVKNNCPDLHVGESYQFKRNRGSADLLVLDGFEGGTAVLTVEEESVNSR